MAQTPAAVNTRINAPTGYALGGARERAFRTLALQLVEAGKNMETLFPDATHSTDKTNIFNTLDTLVTYLNTAAGKLTN